MKTHNIKQLALAFTLATTPFSFAEETAVHDNPATNATEPAAQPAGGTLTRVIADGQTFSTLTAAIKAAGLEETLGGSDNYTIFAPTDEAFTKLKAGTLDKLLLPENKEKLRSLLMYHVIAGKVMAADLKDDMEVKTMNGETLKIDIDGDKVKANSAILYSMDVPAENGVMHAVGEVIVPKSLDEFADLED